MAIYARAGGRRRRNTSRWPPFVATSRADCGMFSRCRFLVSVDFFARELAAEDEHGETGVVGGAEMRLSHLRTPRLLCSSSSAEVTNSTLAVLHDDHDHPDADDLSLLSVSLVVLSSFFSSFSPPSLLPEWRLSPPMPCSILNSPRALPTSSPPTLIQAKYTTSRHGADTPCLAPPTTASPPLPPPTLFSPMRTAL